MKTAMREVRQAAAATKSDAARGTRSKRSPRAEPAKPAEHLIQAQLMNSKVTLEDPTDREIVKEIASIMIIKALKTKMANEEFQSDQKLVYICKV